MTILDKDIYPLFSDVESINTAIDKLNCLSRFVQSQYTTPDDFIDGEQGLINHNKDIATTQPAILEQLRTLESYASDVRRKCQLLLVQAEEGAALSAQELKLLNELMEN